MSKNADASAFINEVYKTKAKEVEKIKTNALKETILKEAAITKMEELRGEVELLKGDQGEAYSVMRDQINQLKHQL